MWGGWEGEERERERQKKTSAADKLQARISLSTAVFENDESGIIVIPAMNVVISGPFLQRQHLPVAAFALQGAIMGSPFLRGFDVRRECFSSLFIFFKRTNTSGGGIHNN